MSLKEFVAKIETDIGLYSNKFKTLDSKNHKETSQNIPLKRKPAQQFLSGLELPKEDKARVSKNVTIEGFSEHDNKETLTLSADRINHLLQSSKIYVNTAIFPAGLYPKALQQLVKPQDHEKSEEAKIHWQNLALGVCHAQEIDLLIGYLNHPDTNKALIIARQGEIDKKKPSILLLSSPTLQFKKDGLANALTKEEQLRYIEAMYRNLFSAAVNEGREYFVLGASGISHDGGNHEDYFKSLVKIAKEFPKLKIIYNPESHGKKLTSILSKDKPFNVVQTNKNILFLAQKIIDAGKTCALHNPSHADVIYGQCDIGDKWKEKNSYFSFANFIGSMTTAALNSHSINPHAYDQIIERKLAPKNKKSDHRIKRPPAQIDKHPEEKHDGNCTKSSEEKGQVKVEPSQPKLNMDPIPLELIAIPTSGKSPTPVSMPKPIEPPLSTASSNGIFKPPVNNNIDKPTATEIEHSSLKEDQLHEINFVINRLQREIDSWWPYPNKDVKQDKIDALNHLKNTAKTHSVSEAIAIVKRDYPRVDQGYISTRTSDLLNKLLNAENRVLSQA